MDEAMERDVSLVTPVNFMPNGGLEQKLTGDSTTTSSSPSPLRSDEKVKSRYLSPPMASCHDFCKYGKKHDSDAEDRRLNLRKFLKKKKKEKLTQDEEQNQVTIVVPAERRTRTVTKPKATTKVGTEFPDNAGGLNPRTPPTMKNVIKSGEKKTLKTSLDNEQGQAKSQDPGDGRKVKVINGGTKLLDNTEGPKPQTLPTMKNSIASGEKDALDISLDNEHGQGKSRDPRDGKKVEVIKGGTELPANIEGPKPQTLSTMENTVASGEKKSLQTPLENKHGQAKSLNPRDGRKVTMIKEGTPLPSLQSRPPNQPDAIKLEEFSPTYGMDTSKQPNIINNEKTKSSVKKPISPVAPKVVRQKAPTSVTEHQKIKQKVPLPAKTVDGAGKPAITLKTKAPLVRSLSQRKSSRSLIARRNQENKITSLGTSKIGSGELLKPSTKSFSSKSSRTLIARRNQDNMVAKSLTTSKAGERKIFKQTRLSFSSKKPEDNASSLQLRKLRCMKRTSTPHETGLSLPSRKLMSTKLNSVSHHSVPSMQPRKLRNIKQQRSTPNDSVPIMQLRKLRSIKQTSKPDDIVPSLQLRKLRSVKQTSTPHEKGSSLQPRKLWNVKLTSALRDNVSILQPKKLRSMKRNYSMKDKNKLGKANNTESRSGNNDLDPNPEIEASESAISEVSDEEVEGNDNVEVSKDDKKRARRTVTAPAQPDDNSSMPFNLKFKRGKVINLRSDSIGARRLWFNIGRLASENLNGNGLLGRRTFRRRRNNASIDSKDPDSGVQSVVLKHQGVTEKKDGQSLLNHVIEETASKLVETRKSKVKALVGAFETVISLQESKPASAV